MPGFVVMALHPVGPLPASTYWRRRLVLLAVVVLVVLVARSCVGGGSPRPTAGSRPTPTPTTHVTHTPSPRPSPTRAAGPVTCADRALTLSTSIDVARFPAGGTPRFTVTVKNTSGQPCRRDLGPLELIVKSGEDRIWSSTDCAPKGTASVQTLAAGGTLQTTKTWDGKRSARGCSGTREQARPGTYTVRARVSTLTSTVTVFRITS